MLPLINIPINRYVYFQWKKKMEKQRAAIKFKAAARIARVTHDLTNAVRAANIEENGEETEMEAE